MIIFKIKYSEEGWTYKRADDMSRGVLDLSVNHFVNQQRKNGHIRGTIMF
jgi:hypothetical protein